MPFFLTEKLGPRQSLTPEGFLICHDVGIARTGTMLYAAGEVPVTAKDGIVTIERTDDHVFSPETLASFEGKAVTLDHPMEDVDPNNWSELAKGFATNVRRGTGLDADLMVADLVITEAKAIKEVRDGLREVSCGYDANYEEIAPGRGRQTDIVGNHIALVEKGRCGSRCAIGDKAMKWIDRLRAAFKAHDEAAFEALAKTRDGENPFAKESDEDEEKKKKDEDESKTADALSAIASTLSTIDSRLTALETRDAKAKDEDEDEDEEKKKKKDAPTEDEAEEEADEKAKKDSDADGKTEDEDEESEEEKEAKGKGKTGDSAGLRDEAIDVFARAEILSPGLQMPTFDAAATPARTKDALCNLRRKALETAFNAGTYRDAITPFLGKTPDFKKLTCDAMTSAFVGASEIVRRTNNAQNLSSTFDGAKDAAKVASSISNINRRNAEFWARK